MFAPQFLPANDWYPEFQSLATRVLHDLKLNAEICPRSLTELLVEFDKFEMTIDRQRGSFGIFERGFHISSDDPLEDEDDDLSQWMGPVCSPAMFLEELADPQIISVLGNERHAIGDFASSIYVRMKRRFNAALEEGIGEITARVGSLGADPTVLDYRLLDHLTFKTIYRDPLGFGEDLRLDDAESKTGRVAFLLLGVAPTRRRQNGSAESASKPGRRRGPPVQFEPARVIDAIVKQLLVKGMPATDKYGAWTWDALAKAVKSDWGANPPSPNTILKQKIPAMTQYKKLRAQKGFQQSNK